MDLYTNTIDAQISRRIEVECPPPLLHSNTVSMYGYYKNISIGIYKIVNRINIVIVAKPADLFAGLFFLSRDVASSFLADVSRAITSELASIMSNGSPSEPERKHIT